MSVNVSRAAASELAAALDELAALRITVFREFPYLYEGSREYEAGYLRSYLHSPRSCVVLARDGARVVGASTAMPLAEHGESGVVAALSGGGHQASEVYYFGESVLLPEYRGRGLGNAFFAAREAAAREYGLRIAAFCAVQRADDHPLRPVDYAPHDAFWSRRGYHKRPDITAQFSWRDLNEPRESAKTMVFWLKELS